MKYICDMGAALLSVYLLYSHIYHFQDGVCENIIIESVTMSNLHLANLSEARKYLLFMSFGLLLSGIRTILE